MNHTLRVSSLLLLLTTALGACPIIGHAQGLVFGVKGGVTLSNLYSTDVNDKNGRIGFNVGILGRTDPEQPIGVQAELLYNTKGETFNYNGFLVDQEFKLNLGYIDLPVMASFRVVKALEIQAGGYAGVLISSNLTSSGDLGSHADDLDKSNFNSLDYGLVGGIALNAEAFQIGARYNYGLGQLANSDAAKLILGDARNSFAQVYLAFGFGQ